MGSVEHPNPQGTALFFLFCCSFSQEKNKARESSVRAEHKRKGKKRMAPTSVTDSSMVGVVPRAFFEAARLGCTKPWADTTENFRYHLLKTYIGPLGPNSTPPRWIDDVAHVFRCVIPDASLVAVVNREASLIYFMFFSETVVGTFVGSEFH